MSDIFTPYVEAILGDYPDFQINTVETLGEGMDNIALEINKEFIFRFCKKYNQAFDTELKVLEYLQDKVTLKIPKVAFTGKTCQYMGYKKIAGSSLDTDVLNTLNDEEYKQLVHDWVRFLREIHTLLPIETARTLGVKKDNSEDIIARVLSDPLDFIDSGMALFIKDCVRSLSTSVDRQHVSFIHDDLHFNNITFDLHSRRLTGVFDFGDVAIGDIHQEFEPILKRDLRFFRAVQSEYARQSGLEISERRVMQYSVLYQAKNLIINRENQSSERYAKALNRIGKWREHYRIE
jgi:aminoglycoside 2''-phosphotransferase